MLERIFRGTRAAQALTEGSVIRPCGIYCTGNFGGIEVSAPFYTADGDFVLWRWNQGEGPERWHRSKISYGVRGGASFRAGYQRISFSEVLRLPELDFPRRF